MHFHSTTVLKRMKLAASGRPSPSTPVPSPDCEMSDTCEYHTRTGLCPSRVSQMTSLLSVAPDQRAVFAR